MSNFKKWGELYEIYKTTHRASVVKSLFKNKSLNQSWPYWMALSTYVAISSVVVYIVGKVSPLSIFSIVLTASIIYIWLEFRIAKEYRKYYSAQNLKAHPFFLRTKYLSYVLFSEKLSESTTISTDNVGALVEWENIRKEKTDIFTFFKTPGILLVFTIFSSIIIEYLKLENLVNTRYLFLFLLVIFVVLWFSWIVSDALKSHKKKSLEICRFLKWWKLDN